MKDETEQQEGIAEFLNTKTPKPDLAKALDVLREFKECESSEEWAFTPFIAWAKLEQLEGFLNHLVNGKPLKSDGTAPTHGTT